MPTRRITILIIVFAAFFAASCSPEVGSKAWCEQMTKKPKDSWTMEEVGNFTKHCLL